MASKENSVRQTAAEKPCIIRPMSHFLPEHLSSQGSIGAVHDVFHRGVALTVLEHPMLQVGILDEDSALPSWIQLDIVDLSAHIEWKEVKSSDDYDVELQKEIRRQLDTWFVNVESQPGWRISVLRPEQSLNSLDVIFCWNHANLDGVAGKILHQTLLPNLNDPRVKAELPSLKGTVLQLESVADRFPPPPEQLVEIPISLYYAASTIWKELKPPFLATNDATQATWAPIRQEPYRTVFRTFSIDDATLKNVVGACRKHKTTITGLLHALPLASLAVQLAEGKEHHKEEANAMHAITALDIRRFMPTKPEGYPWHVPGKTIDNQMSLCDHTFDAKLVADIRSKARDASSDDETMARLEDIVWSAAARSREEIQQKLDQRMSNDPLGLMKFVKDWRAQKKSQLKKPRVGAWGVSNLGVLDGDVEGDGWRIERAVFQLSCELTSPVFHISSISVKDKELCVDVSWQEGIIDVAVGEKLASDIEAWMRFLGARLAV
ncbi:hypothetical protein FZEAL_7956 [Fusarium zealandicum]|uniref:Alcohol acetyltransferase n=1 Tax=Fusarium zealandicum TaxID=1053134 RepID=A0A8H4XHD4_9HYPO|nr:hypothetical protein FZEAL_7956 [Fusarium zealandicum]